MPQAPPVRHRGTVSLIFLFLAAITPLVSQTTVQAHGPLELTSALGRPLYALPEDHSVADARKALISKPTSPDLALALSKALAGRRQYNEAVAVDTEALKSAPQNADLLLERGHRELGLRHFQPAMADLEQASRLNPQMLDAFYHLGLSHYFLGQFAAAAAAFTRARDLARTDDSLIDCTAWLYNSLRRAHQEPEAAAALARITPAVHNMEPHLLFYLRLLRFYQGQIPPESILPPPPSGPADLEGELSFNTVSYGVGNWNLYHGDNPAALKLFRGVVKGEAWNSWGFIGSEVELSHPRAAITPATAD